MIPLLLAVVIATAQAASPAAIEADAWRAVQERRAADAERLFDELTSRRPDDARAWLGYAAAALLAGRAADAIRVLERAAAAGAADRALAGRLARLRAEQDLHAGFNQSNSARFTVLFEGPPEQSLAEAVIADLDAAWERIAAALFAPPAGPITVTLYTERQFTDITRAPAWAAAAYDGRIRVPMRGALADRAELARVLTHELAHAFRARHGAAQRADMAR